MYPAPVRRTIVHISWNEEAGEVMSGLAALSPDSPDQGTPGDPEGVTVAAVEEAEDGWTLILVRGVVDDWDLLHFDARFDTGRFPAEWLWGPGSPRDAMSWLAGHQPLDDEVDVLDRVFLLRYQDPILEVPRNPDQAASVSDDEKPGTWYVIRADSPEQAFNHQRQTLAGGFDCADHGTCPRCPVQTLGTGTWQEAMDVLAAHGIPTRTLRVPDIRVPSRMGWPRCNRILGNGTWDIPPGEH
jgi:hypothetical protein